MKMRSTYVSLDALMKACALTLLLLLLLLLLAGQAV
jgi:hypothetical protein